jgi:hypothetical protein
VARRRHVVEAELVERLADHEHRGDLRERPPVAFDTNGTVRLARGFTSRM